MSDIPWDALFEVATQTRERSHSPYSHFPVGAAVLYADGSIVPGCNVENATFGLTVCAERLALASGRRARIPSPSPSWRRPRSPVLPAACVVR